MVTRRKTLTLKEPRMAIKRKAITYYIFTCDVCGKEVRSDSDHPESGVAGRFMDYSEDSAPAAHSFYLCSNSASHINKAVKAYLSLRTEETNEEKEIDGDP
jgi:hypothetical protein